MAGLHGAGLPLLYPYNARIVGCRNVTKNLFTLPFCYFCTRRKWRQNTPNLATWRIVLENVARYVCKHNTLRLKFNHVIFTEKPRQKVCKNRRKVLVLQGVLCKTALLNEKLKMKN